MSVAEKFGSFVESVNRSNPGLSRNIMRLGWKAEDLLLKYHPNRESYPADQYLAGLMMDAMLKPLQEPEHSAICSIFMPCELVQEAGLNPYNVEAFSCYIAASFAERSCIGAAEASGISDTLCSYHRTFVGAALNGLMPKPRCIVYTNLTCDANLLTFSKLADFYKVPSFMLDVPRDISESSVEYVSRQLRELRCFLERVTGRDISDDSLKSRVDRSRRTLTLFEDYQQLRADRYVPADLCTPLYSAMSANILLGTKEEEKYVTMCLEDLKNAPPKKGKHIYWMHSLPFWSSSVKEYFYFKENAQIVGDELSQVCRSDFPEGDPYYAMAYRVVHNTLNGSSKRRIDAGIEHAKEVGADGVIWYNHWGCKHTLGNSRLAKTAFEEAGFPTLILDGDGCDRSFGSEGQTLTRIGAFMEMLEKDR